jgi:hypothetical protein
MGGKLNTGLAGAATGAQLGGPWGAAAGLAGGFLLGEDDKSQSTMADLLKQAQDIPLPILKEFYPELYKQVVQLNPEMEKAQTLGPSAMEDVYVDPNLKQAQMNALLKLQGIGETGMSATDKARLSQIQGDVNTNLQGQTGAIMQNMAARGMSGGMSEMVARQLAAQQGANRQAQMGMDVKAQAEQRALDAIMQSGQLGGQMGQQQFSQDSQKAQARDVINKFNTQNQQDVGMRNVGSRNTAQASNAQNIQNIANQNVGLSNQAQQFNNSLSQQNYDNNMKKYGIISGATQGMANAQSQGAAANNAFLGNALSSAATAYAASQKKKEV